VVLELSADSSVLTRAGAALILSLHITGGCVGLVSGAAALVFRKGAFAHRRAGNLFFVSMLIMAAIGAIVSLFLPQPDWVNVVAGTFTLYLVATAWAAVKREAGSVGRFEVAALGVALCIAVAGPVVGWPSKVGSSSDRAALVFGLIAAFAAIGDARMLARGGVSGVQRIARHLWRMCLALFIAAGSLFGGQQQVFPAWMRGWLLATVPVLAVFGVMIYWLIRVRWSKAPAHDDEGSARLTVDAVHRA
jgi:hypothetical protein